MNETELRQALAEANGTMDKPMTAEEFLLALKSIDERHGDAEAFHDYADRLICNLLRSLGYEEGVAYFEDHEKWYS